MTKTNKPRLRFFEESPGQRHVEAHDRYLYSRPAAQHKVNVIGTGTIGMEHMRVAALLGRVGINGIYDPQPASVATALDEYAKLSEETPTVYSSVEEACNASEADALMICTPNYTHIDVFEVASQSGKPIFLEKPMATTLDDAKRIVEISKNYPGFIQVGLQYRYKAPYVEARYEALVRGTLGNIHMLYMSEYRPPFLDKVGQWNKFNDESGGTLVEKCCHYFDLLASFAGGRPRRVYASCGRAVNFTDFAREGVASDIDDHAFVIIDFDNNVRANFTLNMFAPTFHEELIISGDRGRLIANERFDFQNEDVARSEVVVELGEEGASRRTDIGYARPIEHSGHHGSTYMEHIAFADQLEGKTVDAATPAQGLWSIVIAVAAQESARSGQPIDVQSLIDTHGLETVIQA